MTTDVYGRDVGRHRRWQDMPPGYSLGDPDRPANRMCWLLGVDDDEGERYDRPVLPVSVVHERAGVRS